MRSRTARLMLAITAAAMVAAVFGANAAYASVTEAEPNNDRPSATAVAVEDIVFGSVSPAGDLDIFSMTLTAGHRYHITVNGTYGFDPGVTVVSGVGYTYTMMNDQTLTPAASAPRTDAVLDFVPPVDGTYYFYVWGGDWLASTGDYVLNVHDEGTSFGPMYIGRIGGADRYEVASAVMANSFLGLTGIRDVVITSGLDAAMADPLSASGLAGAYDAPILLVRADRAYLPAPTVTAIAAIKSINPTTTLHLHIVGGPASVPDRLKAQLLRYAPGSTIDRVSGADRYEVAANVAARIRTIKGPGYPSTCFVVNGQNKNAFYDALACGPIAFAQKFPILLVRNGGAIPAPTTAALAKYTTRYVVSTGSAVPLATATALGATYLSGSSRERTARLVTELATWDGTKHWLGYAGGSGWASDVILTNKLSDALTCGVLGGKGADGILYTDATGTDPTLDTIEYVSRRWAHDSHDLWIVGGAASVSTSCANLLGGIAGDISKF